MENEIQVQIIFIGVILFLIWINTLFVALNIEMSVSTVVFTLISALMSIVFLIFPEILVE